MRRHVATFVAAAMLLSIAGPAMANGTSAAPSSVAPAVDTADPAGRWIVLYRGNADTAAATEERSVRAGFRADRIFTNGIHGFAAALTSDQVADLRDDLAVAAVVPDERIELEAQVTPNGISRIGTRSSPGALIDGVDQRIDADVAIVDTGIARIADLNVVGGHDCSTSDPNRWRDAHGHGTHVAGTIGAIDNGSGVVGVAPGVRLWAVKILDDTGSGLLSWYVCGLDWILAQRDPADPSRPLIEAVNMSVAKWGRDTGGCGVASADILHGAICRLVSDGVTVVAAAANDSGNAAERVPASYDEVITVSALADSDGKPGGLGGNLCLSWGTYDTDDTFANFSNYGADVDIIAPGKCIWSTLPGGFGYSSGTSMAAPHVTGAAALVKSFRPYFTPAEVKEALQSLGTLDWLVSSDPDNMHERLLDVSRIGPRGDFALSVPEVPAVSTSGGTISFTVTLTRTETMFDRIVFRPTHLPPGVRATFADKSLYGFEDVTTTMEVKVSDGLAPGTHHLTVVGQDHDIAREATATFQVTGSPVPPPPTTDAPPRGLVEVVEMPRTVSTGSTGIRSRSGAAVPDPAGDAAGTPAGAGTGGAPTEATAPNPQPAVQSVEPATTSVSSVLPVATTRVATPPARIFLRFLFAIAR
jgi:subtilisin family serine protease